MSRRPVPVVLAAFALALTGCSDSSSGEASTAYCDAAETLRGELVAFGESVAGDEPVADVRERAEAVEEAYSDALEAGEDLEEARSAEVEQARDDFEAAVEAIDEDLPLSEAAEELQAAASTYQDQVQDARESVGCEAA